MKHAFFKQNLTFLVIATFLVCGFFIPNYMAQATGTWFVSESGNDGYDCLSVETSCLTIQEAIVKASSGDTINVGAGTYALDSQLRITKSISIIGAGDSTLITKGVTDWTNNTGSKGYASLITINSGSEAVQLKNIKVAGAKHITMTGPGAGKTDYGTGINVVSSSDVTLNNITSESNEAAGLIVNSSVVVAENLNTTGNHWYSVNIDKSDSGDASLTLTGSGILAENVQIKSDKTIGTTVYATGYTQYKENGTTKTFWTNRELTNAATITNDGTTTYFTTIQSAVAAAQDGDTINVANGIYEFSEQLNITKPLSIIGQGEVTFKAVNPSWSNDNSSKHLLGLFSGTESAPISLTNIIIDANTQSSGINTYNNAYVVLTDVTIKNSKNAAMIVNGSTVKATNLNTSGNVWGAINVDPGSGVVTPSVFELISGQLAEDTQIWSDGVNVTGSATVTVTANGYSKYLKGGTNVNFWTNKTLSNAVVITRAEVSTYYATVESAVAASQDGDVIKIAPGNYNIIRDTVTQVSGQAGWYLPITKNDITLVGIDASGNEITNASNALANLYSIDETPNGAWASQNLITVFGDNVTIKGLVIMNKISPNKGIEVVGNNFKAEHCQFTPVPLSIFSTAANYYGDDITKYGSGVYFNNNAATTARTGSVTNNIFKHSGITFDSFKDNWTVNITNNIFDSNKVWSWTDNSGFHSQYYSAIGATTWANQPDFTGSSINIANNKFINMDSSQVIVKIKETMTGRFNAEKNWWGTTLLDDISALVYGDVDFDPWFTNAERTTLSNSTVIPSDNGDVTITDETPKVVVTDQNQAINVTIDSGTTDATIDLSNLITAGTGGIPQITINSSFGTGNAAAATINIPATTVTGPADWDGVISAPTVTTVSLPETSGQTKTLSTAIEIGFAGAKLSFDKAVRILLPGQAGKRAGYIRTGTVFTEITDTCALDDQVTGDALVVDGDCKIDVGTDLVIWTKHFTSFAAYTQTTNSGGGGGGGSSIINNTPTYCTAVVYSEWGACVNGMQYRDLVSQAPNGCTLSSAQQLDRSKTCGTEPVVTNNNQPVRQNPFFTRNNNNGNNNNGNNNAGNNNAGNNNANRPGVVLGERVFAEGTLIRIVGNPRTYVIINGKQVHIKTLAELAKYRGQKINFYYADGRAVDQVLGVKTLPDGSLVRLVGSNKIYIMVNGQRVHIKTQAELDKYKGKKINLIND